MRYLSVDQSAGPTDTFVAGLYTGKWFHVLRVSRELDDVHIISGHKPSLTKGHTWRRRTGIKPETYLEDGYSRSTIKWITPIQESIGRDLQYSSLNVFLIPAYIHSVSFCIQKNIPHFTRLPICKSILREYMTNAQGVHLCKTQKTSQGFFFNDR